MFQIQCFSTRRDIIPWGHEAMSGDTVRCQNQGLLLASSGLRPGTISTKQNYLDQNVHSAEV